jgi:uncharacterized membrane protein YkgB
MSAQFIGAPTRGSHTARFTEQQRSSTMNSVTNVVVAVLSRSGILKGDIDCHLIRASMVLIFLAFGYQKWFAYEAQVLIPYISNGPFIFWMYPVFGIRGASWFLGVSEWLICALLFLGFWDKRLGILGAIGSTITFTSTVTIIPFMPNGWDPAAGFPAMAGNVPFLMKDVVLVAASIYLLKQDALRVSLSAKHDPHAAVRAGGAAITPLPAEDAVSLQAALDALKGEFEAGKRSTRLIARREENAR